MKHFIILTTLVIAMGSQVFCAGGLECVNEPPPPRCSQITTWTTCNAGFGEAASLQTDIDVTNGNFRTSFAAGGVFPEGMPMVFYHNSRDNRTYPAGVGRNHTFSPMLYIHPDEWYFTAARVVVPTGYRVSFDQNLDGTYRGEPGVFARLVKLPDNSYMYYTDNSPNMVDDGNVEYHFGPADVTGRARLLSIDDGERRLTFTYVTSGYGLGEVSRVREESTGREIVFNYNSNSRLQSVKSFDNVVTTLEYDAAGNLTSVQSSWGTLTFTCDANYNIRSITDGLGGHAAYILYGPSARGIEFRNASDQVFDFSYTVDSAGNVITTTAGLRGETPTVYEINKSKLVASVTAPGSAKVSYTYTPDKCLCGQSYSAVPQETRVAEANLSQPSGS